MASIVLDWKLFRGGQNRSRLQQARLDAQRLHTQHDELQRQIALQVQEATDNLEAARESLRTARERLRSSREGYRLTSRKYEEGMSNQVAFLDVRTTFTEAEINFNITYYDVLIRLAELEYAAAVDRPPAP
jgi:outer membrane protein TolC